MVRFFLGGPLGIRSWTQWSLWVPSNAGYSMIPIWVYRCFSLPNLTSYLRKKYGKWEGHVFVGKRWEKVMVLSWTAWLVWTLAAGNFSLLCCRGVWLLAKPKSTRNTSPRDLTLKGTSSSRSSLLQWEKTVENHSIKFALTVQKCVPQCAFSSSFPYILS